MIRVAIVTTGGVAALLCGVATADWGLRPLRASLVEPAPQIVASDAGAIGASASGAVQPISDPASAPSATLKPAVARGPQLPFADAEIARASSDGATDAPAPQVDPGPDLRAAPDARDSIFRAPPSDDVLPVHPDPSDTTPSETSSSSAGPN